MNIHEAVKNLKALKDDSMDGVVEELEKQFGLLPEVLKDVLNMKPDHYETLKADPLIKLSKTSILNFEYNFSYDILNKGMIPLFDKFDGDYVVYRVKEKDYCIFSITSEVPFRITEDIFALIAKYF